MIFASILISLISLLVLVLIIERHGRAWAVRPVRVKKQR